MAFTSQQIRDYLIANPGMTDAQIVAAMETFQISPAQMASAVGLDEGVVAARVAATVPQGQSIILGDTRVAPQYQTTGSGMDQQVGGLENVYVEKVPTADVNYKSPVGTPIQVYSPTGEFVNTIKTQKEQSFFGGLGEALTDPVVLAALAGGYGAGLFGGTGALGGAATVGTTGLTAGEIAALTAGDLAIGGGALAGTAPLTAAQIAALTATDLAIGAGTPSAASTAGLLSPAITSGVAPAVAGTTAATTIPAATAATTAASALTPTATSLLAPAATSVLAPAVASALTPTATNIATSLIPTAVRNLLTPTNIGNLVQQGATTGAGLLQQQTSREAAQRAQAMIDAETAAAKQAAQFRPIGMTTRFGTSQFQVDPVTGQLTSAGYTLSPEAKNAQDRFLTLAGAGLTQAEQAQQQFAPLQTGAQRLFGLGNQYLAQNPQEVAQNYLNQQMALLQPGRETELANLQNRLQQQGRGGLSVAQGGTMGATTPELQALYNARAQQEAQLAANAQQFGQQQVQFGAGLLGTGAQTMGQYYGGQQAAYAPFTSAFGQMQALEAAGQQPFGMSTALAQQASQAGANVGRLGLSGAEFSTRLATSPAATTNPYSTLLGGVGASNQFGQFVGGLLGGTPTTAMSAPATTFGTGNYYGSQDLGLYL
jgi:hypothetical protein